MAKHTRPATPAPRPRGQESKRKPAGGRLVVLASALGVIAVVAVAIVVLRNDESKGPTLRDLVAGSDPGPIHVHGLGVNPSDRSLLIATHTGLFRVADGETKAQRVTNRYQDTMGFTIVGRDRFLGSGHPDINEARDKGLPGLLGLIESQDAGMTWQPISLLGEADFHVLRSLGTRVYGYDATNSRLMLSRDAGRSWTERPPPAPLVDLAVEPTKPTHLVASGGSVLFESFDEGKTWNVLGTQSGLLAWPLSDKLFLVRGDGQVLVSGSRGKNWRGVGEIGGQPAAFLARGAADLYTALHDGTIKRSTNGGRAWTVRSTP